MAFGDRRERRVAFRGGVPAQLVGADRSWRLSCRVFDISRSGAKVVLPGRLPEKSSITEFHLEFCPSVARRCRLARLDGTCLGVQFVRMPAELFGDGKIDGGKKSFVEV